ncbi:alpha/beta hydrolase-fold protein [Oceanicaulis alexandrii]|uniref:alpha/beta hydrolase n=1 Tax=Oceanicaulis alexandrii TaxID=153233 RepID=UPI0035D08EC5
MILAVTHALMMTLSLAQAEQHPPYEWNRYPLCEHVEAYVPEPGGLEARQRSIALEACQLPTDMISISDVDAGLNGQSLALLPDLHRSTVTILARQDDDASLGVLGTFRMPLTKIGEGRYAARLRLAHMDTALMTVFLNSESPTTNTEPVIWRGPIAPDQAPRQSELMGRVEHHKVFSEAHGETRRVDVYLPPEHDLNAGPYPVVFMTDGAETAHFAHQVEAAIKAGELAPLIIVGALSGQSGVVEDMSDFPTDLRAADYLAGWYEDEPRAQEHQSFFANALTDWASERFGASMQREDRAVLGFSNGASFARDAGYRRGDMFGWVMAYSPGRGPIRSVEDIDHPRARFRFAAGRYEPGFQLSSQLTHEVLSAAGYDSRIELFSTGHTRDVRDVVLSDWLGEAFPPPAPVHQP